jgi:hypothetical protein
MKRCDACTHWTKLKGGGMGHHAPHRDKQPGECRALPPQAIVKLARNKTCGNSGASTMEYTAQSLWPEVLSGQYCGHFSKKDLVATPVDVTQAA